MSSTNSTPTSPDFPPAFCAYCKTELEHEAEIIADHIVTCPQRPENGLLLKLQLLYDVGDALMQTLHAMATVIGTVEGGRTQVWELYRQEQEKWDIAKNINPKDLSDSVNSEMLK